MLEYQKEIDSLCQKLSIETIKDVDYFPRYIEIESYDGCNINCTMCPLGKDIYDGGGIIPMDLFDNIIDQISPYSEWINLVCLSRNGEPLLNKNLHVMVRKLKNIGIKRVNFSTNATALTKKRSYELVESGLDEIRFSIDGYHKETLEKVRKGVIHEKLLANVFNFIKIRNESGLNKPQIQIRFVEQEENKGEIELCRDFWLSKLEDYDLVASKEMHSWGNELDNFEGKVDSSVNHPCISPFSTLEILYDGTVPLCGCDYLPTVVLGNVNNNSIIDIWRSERFKEIRNDHANGKRNNIDICAGCKIWDENIKTTYIGERPDSGPW